jgi:hypothetical protein
MNLGNSCLFYYGVPDYSALEKKGWRKYESRNPVMVTKDWEGLQLYVWTAQEVGQTCLGVMTNDLFGIEWEVAMRAFEYMRGEVECAKSARREQ